MNNSIKTALACSSICVFGGFVAWRTHVSAQVKPPVYGIVADLTSSHELDRSHACLSSRWPYRDRSRSGVRTAGAQLSVLALGDSSRAGEPVALSEQSEIPDAEGPLYRRRCLARAATLLRSLYL